MNSPTKLGEKCDNQVRIDITCHGTDRQSVVDKVDRKVNEILRGEQ